MGEEVTQCDERVRRGRVAQRPAEVIGDIAVKVDCARVGQFLCHQSQGHFGDRGDADLGVRRHRTVGARRDMGAASGARKDHRITLHHDERHAGKGMGRVAVTGCEAFEALIGSGCGKGRVIDASGKERDEAKTEKEGVEAAGRLRHGLVLQGLLGAAGPADEDLGAGVDDGAFDQGRVFDEERGGAVAEGSGLLVGGEAAPGGGTAIDEHFGADGLQPFGHALGEVRLGADIDKGDLMVSRRQRLHGLLACVAILQAVKRQGRIRHYRQSFCAYLMDEKRRIAEAMQGAGPGV